MYFIYKKKFDDKIIKKKVYLPGTRYQDIPHMKRFVYTVHTMYLKKSKLSVMSALTKNKKISYEIYIIS